MKCFAGLHRTGEEHQLVGMFDNADAAAHAYDQAALKMHGPEAYTNFLCKPCPPSTAGMLTVILLRQRKDLSEAWVLEGQRLCRTCCGGDDSCSGIR